MVQDLSERPTFLPFCSRELPGLDLTLLLKDKVGQDCEVLSGTCRSFLACQALGSASSTMRERGRGRQSGLVLRSHVVPSLSASSLSVLKAWGTQRMCYSVQLLVHGAKAGTFLGVVLEQSDQHIVLCCCLHTHSVV